ncbi:MAG TPA: RNA chaperone Hfq [Terriglobia bacterium]|nr:RNA chaperone Hfq [Terriglobia bacterium]
MHTTVVEKREHTEKQSQNIQDGFLNSARKERALVTIYLVSGVKLTGRIRSFDKFSLILESNHQEQLIFKHAISTVVLPRPAAASAPLTMPASEG